MRAKGSSQEQAGRFDRLKWSLVFLVTAAAIIADYQFSQVPWPIRAAVGIVLLVALIALILQTEKGALAWVFVKGARSELRKVVWPTRPETVQTTVIVVVMVVVTALVLWGFDSLFMWLITWITGQRG